MAEKPTACCFGRLSKVFSNIVYGCAKPPNQVLSLLFAPFSASVMKNMLTVPSTYFHIMPLILVVRFLWVAVSKLIRNTVLIEPGSSNRKRRETTIQFSKRLGK